MNVVYINLFILNKIMDFFYLKLIKLNIKFKNLFN